MLKPKYQEKYQKVFFSLNATLSLSRILLTLPSNILLIWYPGNICDNKEEKKYEYYSHNRLYLQVRGVSPLQEYDEDLRRLSQRPW